MSSESWVKIAIISALFGGVFWHNLVRLWLKTNPFTGEANWGHALVVPAIGLYYLFVHREELIKAQGGQFVWGPVSRPGRLYTSLGLLISGVVMLAVTWHSPGMVNTISRGLMVFGGLVLVLDWSIGVTFFGLILYVYGIYPGQNDYLKDVGMIVTLFGIVLMMYGWNVMRIAWFPVVFLICAIPWPGLVYSWVAEPLQQMAANVAVIVLKTTGVEALCSGTKIIIFSSNLLKPPRVLNVAEACAGMRSLMTFITVSGAIAFLWPRPLWQRVVIVVSAVPIAIFCNVVRISGQGLLDHYVSPEWSESFAHQFVGMVMLFPAFLLILGVAYVLEKIFIEESEEASPTQAPIGKRPLPPPVWSMVGSVHSTDSSKAAVISPAAAPLVAPMVAWVPVAPAKAEGIAASAKGSPATGSDGRNLPPANSRAPGKLPPSLPPPTSSRTPVAAGTPPRPRNFVTPVPQRAIIPPRPAPVNNAMPSPAANSNSTQEAS
jgi:exosortase